MTQNPTDSAGPSQAPRPPSVLDDGFARLRESGYHRESEGRWFGGVCSGLAARWNVDPVLIRAAAIVLAFVGGIGITAYVVLWLLMPDRSGEILAERAIRHGDVLPIILLIAAVVLVFGGVVSIGNGNLWSAPLWLIPVGIVAWFVLTRGRTAPTGPYAGPAGAGPDAGPTGPTGPTGPYAGRQPTTPLIDQGLTPPAPPTPGAPMSVPTSAYATSPTTTYAPPPAGPYGGRPTPPPPPRPIAPPPPPRPRRRRPSGYVALISIGTAIVGFGLGALLDEPLGFPGSAASLGFIIALVGVSGIVLTLGLVGRASGFSGFLTVVLSVMLLGSTAASHVDVGGGVGERTWRPVSSTDRTYTLGAGDATLDLRGLPTPVTDPPVEVGVEMGAGNLVIRVPRDVTTRVVADVGIGSITRPGLAGEVGTSSDSGPGRELRTVIGDGPPQVVVTAELGLGEISIIEEN